MRRYFVAILVAASVVPPTQAADRYAMDAAHSIPTFEFMHLGMTTQTGRFDKVRGTVLLDRLAHKGSIHYMVDATSLNMGFGTETSESPGFRLLEVAKFPAITYSSDELFFDDDDNVVAAAGHLTLLGVTKPIYIWVSQFKCSIHPINRRSLCAANVTATIRRSDFGMLEFIPSISDEIRISVPVEAYID